MLAYVDSALLAFGFLAADAAEEGKKIITAMLLVGLVFIGVIALGETSKALRKRRKARKRAIY